MKALALVLSSFLASACTYTVKTQLRAACESAPINSVQPLTAAEKRALADASVEVHHNFLLGIIEFREDGLAFDKSQLDLIDNRLRETAKERPPVIVVFVHGWRHNASVCDENVTCFREILAALADAASQSRRPVIGIYLGWRGLSYCQEPHEAPRT